MSFPPRRKWKHYPSAAATLKQVDDLLQVNKKEEALQRLHDCMNTGKFKNWTLDNEKVMKKCIEICISLRKNNEQQDALHTYRRTTQYANPKSFEDIINYTIDSVLQEVFKAQQIEGVEKEKIAEMADLEEFQFDQPASAQVPEQLRNYLRYAWDTFRMCLGVLRFCEPLKDFYHVVCKRAYKFCVENQRSSEFRRLCELIRNHLHTYVKQAHDKSEMWPTDLAETHIRTRCGQLKSCLSLNAFMEGFRTIQDVRMILDITNTNNVRREVIASYNEILSDLFWRCGSYRLHSCALDRFWHLNYKFNTKMSAEQKTELATRVLMGILSIPVFSVKANSEPRVEQRRRKEIAGLLGFPETADRDTMLSEFIKKGHLDLVTPLARDIYMKMEKVAHPFSMIKQIKPLLVELKEEELLAKYVRPIEEQVVFKLLNQLSTVFRAVQLNKFKEMIADLTVTFSDALRMVLNASMAGVLNVRVDHKNMAICFNASLDERGNSLPQLATKLHRAMNLIGTPEQKAHKELRESQVVMADQSQHTVHDYMEERRGYFEQREAQLKELEKERQQLEVMEKQREEEERRRREQDRLAKEKIRRETRIKAQIEKSRELENIKRMMKLQGKDVATKDLTNQDAEKVREDTEKMLLKADEEKRRKKKQAFRERVYLENALREAEFEKLKIHMDTKMDKMFDEYQKTVAKQKIVHQQKLLTQKRLARLRGAAQHIKSKFDAEVAAIEAAKRAEEERKEEERLAAEAELIRQEEEEAERIRLAEEELTKKKAELARKAEAKRAKEAEEKKREEAEAAERAQESLNKREALRLKFEAQRVERERAELAKQQAQESNPSSGGGSWRGSRAGGERRMGGDRDQGERRFGGERRMGGDRDQGERRFGGERRMGGDRDQGERRFGGDRRERFGGERRMGGDREQGEWRRSGSDSERSERSTGSYRPPNRAPEADADGFQAVKRRPGRFNR